jgi:TPR repeat protein
MTTPSTSLINLSRILVLALTLSVTPFSFSADFEVGFAAYQKGNFAEALNEWRPLAEQGNASAQFNLGIMYRNGKGVPQDDKAAIKWNTLAAEQGNASAQYNLGLSYNNGEGVPQDYKAAIKWYTLAAEQGFASAQYNLGLSYNNGEGVPQDYKAAIKWYTLAAEQGNTSAQFNLGVMYYDGKGTLVDYVTAHMWLNIASSNGKDPKARNMITEEMTAEQIQEAQTLAREWVKAHSK